MGYIRLCEQQELHAAITQHAITPELYSEMFILHW